MGGRYLVTGVQLGMLISHIKLNKLNDAEDQIQKIMDDQFVGNSDQDINLDVKKTSNIIKES